MFRPGPMENIPSFCARKHGREERALPAPAARAGARRDLRDHGLPGAGDAGRADRSAATRSAAPTCCAARWARRSPRRWPSTATIFRDGAAQEGHRRAEVADEVFDLMEKFAGYGFNKSHAAAYSLLAYHTAWIKAHFAAEFFAANMSVEIDDTDKLKALLDDAHDASASTIAAARRQRRHATASSRSTATRVRYGLGAVKGTGAGRDRGDRRGARRDGGPFTEPVRLLRARRPRRDQPPRRRGADQGRRVRRAASRRARIAARERRPRARLGRDAGRARRPGRPLRRAFGDGDAHGASSEEPPLVAGARRGASRSA